MFALASCPQAEQCSPWSHRHDANVDPPVQLHPSEASQFEHMTNLPFFVGLRNATSECGFRGRADERRTATANHSLRLYPSAGAKPPHRLERNASQPRRGFAPWSVRCLRARLASVRLVIDGYPPCDTRQLSQTRREHLGVGCRLRHDCASSATDHPRAERLSVERFDLVAVATHVYETKASDSPR